MLQRLKQVLSQLIAGGSEVSEARQPRPSIESLTGDRFRHAMNVRCLGEEDAAKLERELAEMERERDYQGQVLRMERLAELRRRELAARSELETLR